MNRHRRVNFRFLGNVAFFIVLVIEIDAGVAFSGWIARKSFDFGWHCRPVVPTFGKLKTESVEISVKGRLARVGELDKKLGLSRLR